MGRNRIRKPKITFLKILRISLLTLLLILVLYGGSFSLALVNILRNTPDIDPYSINKGLEETSLIYDVNGNLIEKIETAEYRTFTKLKNIPQFVKDAFISIEDQRFYEHIGVDLKGIIGSVFENFKAGGIVRGASTITQQLIKNTYLTPEQSIKRKLIEAKLAIELEKKLTKDQILELYLNMISLGQNSYGVQEASQTYFSKNVGDLNIAEAATLAGIVKGPNNYQPYYRVLPKDFNPDTMKKVGEADIIGEKYILVFNQRSVERQKLVLKKMLELGKITQAQYDEASKFDISADLKPAQKKKIDITSYSTDFVKTQVTQDLMDKFGWTHQKAQEAIFTGGLKIYSTIDPVVQKKLEAVYKNFAKVVLGDPSKYKPPVLVDRILDKNGNIVDKNGYVIYYKKENLLDGESNLIIPKGQYELKENGDLNIYSNRLSSYLKSADVFDFYSIDKEKNLVSHTCGVLSIPDKFYHRNSKGNFTINSEFFKSAENFYKIMQDGSLRISKNYFYIDNNGLVQPQSASVIIDYRKGSIVAMIGGRDVDGNRILNRATDTQRQPGSSIKPLAVYLPALDNGFTAASAIYDIPMIADGKIWPKNFYKGFKGIQTLRQAVENSINVCSVRTLKKIGIETSVKYLEMLGIINKEHPERDNFVTKEENPKNNDENYGPLALGGMTKGMSPLDMTAAYGCIANNGIFIKPKIYTKVLDKNGNVLLENTPKITKVISSQKAYVLKDILRTTAMEHTGGNAVVKNQVSAGKTGTTDYNADFWFVGFTNYYVTGTWIGNDSPKITVTQNSRIAAKVWAQIMNSIHEGKEPVKTFKEPEGIVRKYVCTKSGMLPTSLCKSDPRGVIKEEIFAKGTEPTEACNVHISLQVNSENGKIANEYCPDELRVNRVFTVIDPPYRPSAYNGILPQDYSYYPPSRECTKEDYDKYIQEHYNKDDINENNEENDNPIEEINPNENGDE